MAIKRVATCSEGPQFIATFVSAYKPMHICIKHTLTLVSLFLSQQLSEHQKVNLLSVSNSLTNKKKA